MRRALVCQVDGSPATPVTAAATLTFQKAVVDEISAEGGVVRVPALEDVIHPGFGVADTDLEVLNDAIEDLEPLGVRGGYGRQPSVLYEGPQDPRPSIRGVRVGELLGGASG